MASFRPALTETPQRQNWPHWDRPVNSGPRPCLFDVGFPLSGLQDRTHTSDLNVRARHTPARLRQAGVRGRRQHHPPPWLNSCSTPTSPAFSVLALKDIDSSMVSVSPDVEQRGSARGAPLVIAIGGPIPPVGRDPLSIRRDATVPTARHLRAELPSRAESAESSSSVGPAARGSSCPVLAANAKRSSPAIAPRPHRSERAWSGCWAFSADS